MPTIEYYYSAHSAFAYLGSKRLYEISAQHDVTLLHRPFALSPVVEAQKSLPFRDRTQAHVDYFFGREIERWAEYRDVPVLSFRPTHHDADYALAGRMILALGEQGPEVDAMAHALLEAHWRDDIDLSDVAALSQVAEGLGHDARDVIARAQSEGVSARYEAITADAYDRSVFGSPTYVVNGDPFYGQDHLELVERALETPFKPTAWHNPPVDA